MRIWFVSSISIVLVLGALAEIAPGGEPVGTPGTLPTPDVGENSKPSDSQPAGRPKIVVKQLKYDIGKIETDCRGEQDFRVTNGGDAPLLLRQGRSSCGCCTCVCQTQLPEGGKIAPGQTAKVTLKWTIRRFTGAYVQSSTLVTNDPDRPQLTLAVSGTIVPALRATPWQLVFSNALVGQPAVGDVRVYGYRSKPLRIAGCRLGDPATSRFFQTEVVPLSAEQVAKEEGATGGYLLRVSLEPGLPLGAFRQQIILQTNYDSVNHFEVPVAGKVVPPISIVGRGWDSRSGVLSIPVDGGTDARRTVIVMVRGPLAGEATFRIRQVVPECLHVEWGSTTQAEADASVRVPLTLRVSGSDLPPEYLDPDQEKWGEIVIDTNHPQQPRLRLRLDFSSRNG